MINKRTRLFIQFKIINFFHILKTIFHNKKNFLSYLKTFLNVENLSLTSYGRVALFQIVKIFTSTASEKQQRLLMFVKKRKEKMSTCSV